MQGPKLQYRALLDTLALTEKGALIHVLEPHIQVYVCAQASSLISYCFDVA